MNKSLVYGGIIALVLGIVLGSITVSQSHLWGAYQTTSTPYAAFMIPLVIGGIIMIIIGITGSKKRK